MSERKPSDLMLERDALAECIRRPEVIATIGLGEDDFASDAHRAVWRAMQDLLELGEQVDLARIRSRLVDSDTLASVGGEQFLATLRSSVAVKSLPLDRLHKLARIRALRAQAEAVVNACVGNDQDMAFAALDAAQAITSADVAKGGPKSLRVLAEEWQERLGRDPEEGTISPGLPALKRRIGRFDAGSMTLVGAGVNVGKSTLSLEMAMLAMMDGEQVGYLSVEDPDAIVTERLMSMFGSISPKRIRKFRPGDQGAEYIDRAVRTMHRLNDRMLVSNCVGMNEREVLVEMSAMTKAGCRLIILDYIGVVGSSQKQQDRRNEIRWIATRFKARASRTQSALVVISQLQRPKEGDTARKPNKHSFREAGDLEAMAEYAIVMWRTVEDDFSPVYCELVKSKTGGVGYGWTMQREMYPVDSDGYRIANAAGSGRLVEVMHGDERLFDDDGNEVKVRPVMADPGGASRWNPDKSDR